MHTEKYAHNIELITTPGIGDGNPAAAIALQQKIQKSSGQADLQILDAAALPGRWFHQIMTTKTGFFTEYRRNSEKMRDGFFAWLLQVLLYLELEMRLQAAERQGTGIRYSVWSLVQEFPLLGALICRSPRLDFFERILVWVPDQMPKKSGIRAVDRFGVLRVWNEEAFCKLTEEGIPVELVEPFFVSGFESLLAEEGEQEFHERGVPIAVKSSGSGMPTGQVAALMELFETAHIDDYEIHLPDKIIVKNNGRVEVDKCKLDRVQRLTRFFSSLGKNTRIIIGFPSELVAIVHEMRLMGAETQLLALPPRGTHEITNLSWALEKGIAVPFKDSESQEIITPQAFRRLLG